MSTKPSFTPAAPKPSNRALRLAKSFTGKYEFVSFWGGFHGKTMGVLSLMGSDFKDKMGPMVPGSHIVPYAYCYRCPVGLKYPSLRNRLRRTRAQANQNDVRGRSRRADRRTDARLRRKHHPAQGIPTRDQIHRGRNRRALHRR